MDDLKKNVKKNEKSDFLISFLRAKKLLRVL